MHRLHQYIEEGKPIYVRNLSGDHPDEITKLIILEIKPLNGPPRTIKIPPVDPPINLSSMVSPPQILGESQDLLDLINNEVLELVDPAEAQEELRDERAQRIVHKALKDIHSRTAFDPRSRTKSPDGRKRVPRIGRSEADVSGGKNPLQSLMQDAADGMDRELPEIKFAKKDQEVSATVLEMCATLVADASMSESILDDLDIMPEGDLSDSDLGHLIKHAGTKKVIEWASQRLSDRGIEEDGGEETETSNRRKKGRRKKSRR